LSDPIIVTALFGKADAAWFDTLRRAHYPAEHNQLPAHLTMFHHLAPSLAEELKRRLAEETHASSRRPPGSRGLSRLGRAPRSGSRAQSLPKSATG
jgi:hypothetical protein